MIDRPANTTLYMAPLRGFTEYIYRNAFSRHFDGFDIAVAPFIPTMSDARLKRKHLKDVLPEKLNEIVRTIHSGKYYVDNKTLTKEGVNDWLIEKTDAASRPYSDPGEPFHPLSSREMEVLECVTLGMSNKEIANDLGISHQTVKNHVTAILRKLGVEDRTQAAVYALRRGWVRLYEQDTDSEA